MFINGLGNRLAMASITITFPDKSKKSFPNGTTPMEIAASLGPRLAQATLAAKFNGQLVDAFKPLGEDGDLRLLTSKDPEGLEVMRHSCAHVMAQAVKRLHPEARLTIGPVIEDGFYYDFDKLAVTPDDFPAIEAEMKKIVKEDMAVRREDLPKDRALELYPHDPYKRELIREIPDETVSVYFQGDFHDLCRGPHAPRTGRVGAFKLLKVAGAYWRGDSNNAQLLRIYATAWPDEKQLVDYLTRLEEAEKRDHRRLGVQLGLVSFHEESPGAPFFLPKGAFVYTQLMGFLRELYAKMGYREVITPLLYHQSLWETSGHWSHFRENMFCLEIDGQQYALKPMNCPSHCLIYKEQLHSYRELPLRIADFAPLHRNELKGVLAGLTRVRKMSQDDAHIYCAPEQMEAELLALLDMVKHIYTDVFGLAYQVELSTKPEKAMGDDALWARAEAALAAALKKKKVPFKLSPGEGAFYGPKVDVHIQDALGRSWQGATIQVDFQMPERFGLTYEAKDGTRKRPVMIHRAIYGSFERFLALLIEHTGGKFPLWLAPVQAVVIPVGEMHMKYAEKVREQMQKAGLRAQADLSNETVSKKVRNAQLEKVNYILVVGDKEKAAKSVTVRTLDGTVHGQKKAEAFIKKLVKEAQTKARA